MSETIPAKIVIPEPKWQAGDRVYQSFCGTGTVIERRYNNLLHAGQWQYEVKWDSGKTSRHHYCGDLEPA